MRVRYGNGGWVRIDGVGLPGVVYARFDVSADDGWRLHEIYVDGAGEALPTGILRDVPVSTLAVVPAEGRDILESRRPIPGPDLRRLAAHFGTTWGALSHDGAACGTCGGPIKGGRWRHEAGVEEATQNWVAESWFAQFDRSAVKQVPAPRERPVTEPETEEFPVIDSPAGRRITNEFLETVARAYVLAIRKGMYPAPIIAELAQVSPKTVRKWIAKARERGIMPPGTQGKVG
jgi:hypothetical protein